MVITRKNANITCTSNKAIVLDDAHQQQRQNTNNDATTRTIADHDTDEYWPTMTTATQTQHQQHILDFGPYGILQYKSMSSLDMTPLDMTYAEMEEVDYDGYDGTGHLLWLAAVTLAHLLAYRLDCLLPYLPKVVDRDDGSVLTLSHDSTATNSKICELGCGTGGGGMATIIFHCLRSHDKNNNINKNTSSAASSTTPGFHFVFTDNDVETLDLCRSNCELNGIDPQTYSHQLLRWGRENLPKDNNAESRLQIHSFDTVIATDVVYDLQMIRPLMETAVGLLKHNGSGYFILSHVPRFCLSKNETAKESVKKQIPPRERDATDTTVAYVALEAHIVSQAKSLGLVLVDTIRPAKELANIIFPILDATDVYQKEHRDVLQHVTVKDMKEAHAVVLIFTITSSESG
jgi:hypothetical protein